MPTKRDIFKIKMAIERASELSHGAARLGLLVCSHIYNHPQSRFTPDEPFALPWTLCSKLAFKMSKAEVYNCLRELIHLGFLAHCGVQGCPGQAHYRLVFASASSPQVKTPSSLQVKTPSSLQVKQPSCHPKNPARSTQKDAPLTNIFPSEEIVINKEEFPSGDNGGLRPKETKVGIKSGLRPKDGTDGLAALRHNQKLAAAAASHFSQFKKTTKAS